MQLTDKTDRSKKKSPLQQQYRIHRTNLTCIIWMSLDVLYCSAPVGAYHKLRSNYSYVARKKIIKLKLYLNVFAAQVKEWMEECCSTWWGHLVSLWHSKYALRVSLHFYTIILYRIKIICVLYSLSTLIWLFISFILLRTNTLLKTYIWRNCVNSYYAHLKMQQYLSWNTKKKKKKLGLKKLGK